MTQLICLESFLVVGALLFLIGLVIVLTKKNIIQIIMGIELLFNAAALNFVSFSYFRPMVMESLQISGQVISIFIIVIAAADACAALAIVLSLFKISKTVNIQKVSRLKG